VLTELSLLVLVLYDPVLLVVFVVLFESLVLVELLVSVLVL
jgi:hypothetical protein